MAPSNAWFEGVSLHPWNLNIHQLISLLKSLNKYNKVSWKVYRNSILKLGKSRLVLNDILCSERLRLNLSRATLSIKKTQSDQKQTKVRLHTKICEKTDAVIRIRNWIIAATTQCTNHYTITAVIITWNMNLNPSQHEMSLRDLNQFSIDRDISEIS